MDLTSVVRRQAARRRRVAGQLAEARADRPRRLPGARLAPPDRHARQGHDRGRAAPRLPRREGGRPDARTERKRYLRTTPRFQSDQAAGPDAARKIVGDEADCRWRRARLIEKWVYKTLKKSYDANADSALEILESKAGDCTEHSLLFVALCRAAGVPAREVGGLAYVGGKKPAFGWHAWAEIHDGHQWVSVDPTWNQVYVDGTHLKMSEGDRDLAWTNVLGTLKMKVVDVKAGK